MDNYDGKENHSVSNEFCGPRVRKCYDTSVFNLWGHFVVKILPTSSKTNPTRCYFHFKKKKYIEENSVACGEIPLPVPKCLCDYHSKLNFCTNKCVVEQLIISIYS